MTRLVLNWRKMLLLLKRVMISGLLLTSAHYRDPTLIMEQDVMRQLSRKSPPKLSPTMLLLPFDCLMVSQQLQEAEKDRPEMKVTNGSFPYAKLRPLTNVLLCLCLMLLLTGCVHSHGDEIRSGFTGGYAHSTDG